MYLKKEQEQLLNNINYCLLMLFTTGRTEYQVRLELFQTELEKFLKECEKKRFEENEKVKEYVSHKRKTNKNYGRKST